MRGYEPARLIMRGVTWMVVLPLSGCGRDGGNSADPNGSGVPIASLARVLNSTLSDWVSFADSVAYVTVVGEAQTELSSEENERGEGAMIGRILTVTVDDVVWQHPQAPAAPDRFEFVTFGWSLHNGTTIPFISEETPWRIDVGGRYLMAIVKWPREGLRGGWGTINSEMILPVENGRVVTVDKGERTNPRLLTAADELAGLDRAGVAAALTAAVPNPVAEANRDLNPDERMEAIGDALYPTPMTSIPSNCTNPSTSEPVTVTT